MLSLRSSLLSDKARCVQFSPGEVAGLQEQAEASYLIRLASSTVLVVLQQTASQDDVLQAFVQAAVACCLLSDGQVRYLTDSGDLCAVVTAASRMLSDCGQARRQAASREHSLSAAAVTA